MYAGVRTEISLGQIWRYFKRWLIEREPKPYNSWGNGCGMRVSPVGFYARSLNDALELAKNSAEVTHNHPEGIKGALASVAASSNAAVKLGA